MENVEQQIGVTTVPVNAPFLKLIYSQRLINRLF